MQIWDNNKFKKDGLIGECQMNLLSFEGFFYNKNKFSEVSQIIQFRRSNV